MRDPWQVPAFLEYVQPDLTPRAVQDAEERLGVTLPASFLALLGQQNGGFLRATWPDLPDAAIRGIGPGFPSLTENQAWWRDPEAEDEMWVPREPDLLISFEGGGHWDFCFDYREHGPEVEPAIAFVDNDAEQERPLAASFEDFLAGLVDETEQRAIRIDADATVDEFAQALAAQVGSEVVDGGDRGSGFRQLRLDLNGNKRWVWVSANRVPAGFRRSGTDLELVGSALRIPGDESCHLLVECAPTEAADTLAAVQATGYPYRSVQHGQ